MPIDDWSDYDSGPFCPHWDSPYSCQQKCEKCDHFCYDHNSDVNDNWGCTKFFCECKQFMSNK